MAVNQQISDPLADWTGLCVRVQCFPQIGFVGAKVEEVQILLQKEPSFVAGKFPFSLLVQRGVARA
jgi:hypothetical protein